MNTAEQTSMLCTHVLTRQTRATAVLADIDVKALRLMCCAVLRVGNPNFGCVIVLLFEAHLGGAEPMGAVDLM